MHPLYLPKNLLVEGYVWDGEGPASLGADFHRVRTLFCSDLFHQWGRQEAATSNSLLERAKDALVQAEAGPFANYVPYTLHTGKVLHELADYRARTLAVMHGSSYSGDGAQALRDLAVVMREVLGPKAEEGTTALGVAGR